MCLIEFEHRKVKTEYIFNTITVCYVLLYCTVLYYRAYAHMLRLCFNLTYTTEMHITNADV